MKTLRAALLLLVALFALCLAPVPAIGAPLGVMQTPTMTITLNSEPCTDPKVLDHIKDEFHDKFRAGTEVSAGVGYSICWIVDPSMNIYIFAETGENGAIPAAAFKAIP
jgi:hypothetical protein